MVFHGGGLPVVHQAGDRRVDDVLEPPASIVDAALAAEPVRAPGLIVHDAQTPGNPVQAIDRAPHHDRPGRSGEGHRLLTPESEGEFGFDPGGRIAPDHGNERLDVSGQLFFLPGAHHFARSWNLTSGAQYLLPEDGDDQVLEPGSS